MKIAPVAAVKARFGAYPKESEGGPIVVTRNGRPAAILLGIQDEDEIERPLMADSPKARAILDRSRRRIHGGKGLGHEAFWSEVEKPRPARPRGGARGRRA